jgi:cell division protein FtsN
VSKPQARRSHQAPKPAGKPAWVIFFYGLVAGSILTLTAQNIDYSALLQSQNKEKASGAQEQQKPSPKFEFYTVLPEQNLSKPVPKSDSSNQAPSPTPTGTRTDYFIVQAGSFRNEADADQRRAELILLGLDPKIDQVTNQAGRWHRVFIGPLSERSEAERIKALTASQNIETLILSRRSN